MKWKKLGCVFAPDRHDSWMNSHASNPVAEHLNGDIFRIYFSCRDTQNRSHVAYVDIQLSHPFRIVQVAPEPVLSPGEIGTFDDSGVSMSCLIDVEGEKYLYYIGWNLGVTVPWRNSIGLAIQDERTGKFERYSLAPILDRNAVDPFSLSYPFVMEEAKRFKMWYGSNIKWGSKPEEMWHVIKYAESSDAISWNREGKICIDLERPSDYAISRSFVLKEDDIYKMWYSFRGTTYRIGYAESPDGIQWKRKDDLSGIDVSATGWDSEMVEYPFLFDHRGDRYLLYCGNGYGKTGFGLAVLE
jgi:hypothetical protein